MSIVKDFSEKELLRYFLTRKYLMDFREITNTSPLLYILGYGLLCLLPRSIHQVEHLDPVIPWIQISAGIGLMLFFAGSGIFYGIRYLMHYHSLRIRCTEDECLHEDRLTGMLLKTQPYNNKVTIALHCPNCAHRICWVAIDAREKPPTDSDIPFNDPP